jgi:hypothetical protein
MNRRNSLKALLAAAGGAVALPAWAQQWTKADLPPSVGSFSSAEQLTLASIADTIIPKGNAIGALSVGVDKFLVGLLENCYEDDVQQNVKKQLASLNAQAQTVSQRDFYACDQAQREKLLLGFAAAEDKSAKDFFDLMKSETIRGFNTSKEVMLGYLKYKVVPGHYYGCVEATS